MFSLYKKTSQKIHFIKKSLVKRWKHFWQTLIISITVEFLENQPPYPAGVTEYKSCATKVNNIWVTYRVGVAFRCHMNIIHNSYASVIHISHSSASRRLLIFNANNIHMHCFRYTITDTNIIITRSPMMHCSEMWPIRVNTTLAGECQSRKWDLIVFCFLFPCLSLGRVVFSFAN